MKNLIYKLFVFVFGALLVASCESNDFPTIDVNNSRPIAGFGTVEDQTVVFDPSAETSTTYTVGVSTLSNEDRAVVIEVDTTATTLGSSMYSISTLTPVIPAGEFTTEFTVTTIGGGEVPSATAKLVLDLVSVEGAVILEESTSELNIGLNIKCPSVDMSLIPGSYNITRLSFFNFFEETDSTREIIAGPGENQFTVVGGAYPGVGGEDLIFTINPETGNVTAIDQTKLASNQSFGPNTYKFLPGGRVLTCAGIVELDFDFGGSIAGNPNSFNLIKQ